jgi:hypothetical protein
VVGLGTAVGRLHAGTVGIRGAYREALLRLGAPSADADAGLPWPGVGQWQDVEVACTDLGLPDARVAAGDAASVQDRLADPGPFAALTHTDLNPGNGPVTPHGVRLVDFEGAILGHIGFDASFLRFPFPSYSAHWVTLPDAVVTEADRAYCRELAQALGADALDRFDEALAIGAAAALAVRVQRLPLLAAAGQPPRTRWRRRAQLVQQCSPGSPSGPRRCRHWPGGSRGWPRRCRPDGRTRQPRHRHRSPPTDQPDPGTTDDPIGRRHASTGDAGHPRADGGR